MRHDAPEGDIAVSDTPKNRPNPDRARADDSNEPPILNRLHLDRAVSTVALADGNECFAVFLDGARFTDNIESEREEAELELLFFLASFAPRRELQVMETVGVQHDVSAEIWVMDDSLLFKQQSCFFFLIFEVIVARVFLHVVAS